MKIVISLVIELLISIVAVTATTYKVTIHTGNEYWSGTGAKASITLIGVRGPSEVLPLEATSSQLNVGSVDTFHLRTDHHLGKIVGFRLQHDNTGSHPSWLVKKVEIEDQISQGDVYTYPVNKWLQSSNGNAILVKSSSLRRMSCGVQSSSRVVNGKVAKKNSWAWMVHLKISGGGKTFYCGGTLIHPQYILTAAHCFNYHDYASSITATLGEHDTSSGEGSEDSVYAEDLIIHSKYSKKTFVNDIALIKLTKPVMLNKYIKLACIPESKQNVNNGKTCVGTGWGLTSGGGHSATVLQETTLKTLSNRYCRRYWGITDKMVCAKETGTSLCQGDSGGPLQCLQNSKYYVHGVVSFGSKTCPRGGTIVFTRVSSYLDWIESIITAKVTE